MVKAVAESGEPIGIVAQKDGSIDDPGAEDLYSMGTTGRIVKALKAGEEGFHLVLQGIKRFRVLGLTQASPYLRARVVEVKDINADPLKIEALVMNVKKTAREVVALMPEIPAGAAQFVEGIEDPGHLADLIAANMDVSVEEKMEILSLVEVTARLEHVPKKKCPRQLEAVAQIVVGEHRRGFYDVVPQKPGKPQQLVTPCLAGAARDRVA